MTIEKLKIEFGKSLSQKFDDREVQNILRYLIEDLDTEDLIVYQEAVKKILQDMPLAYTTGTAYFFNHRLLVNEHVLIPRPETEELVVHCIQDIPPTSFFQLIDIGTGSGCIAIAIKSKRLLTEILAIDISDEALTVAQENASNLALHIDFKKINFLDNTSWNCLPKGLDIIISNPPYIPPSEKNKMDRSTWMHEPHVALFTPENEPLVFYKKIAEFGLSHLKPNGKIWVEINEFRAEETKQIFKTAGYTNIRLVHDINNKQRMLSCEKSI